MMCDVMDFHNPALYLLKASSRVLPQASVARPVDCRSLFRRWGQGMASSSETNRRWEHSIMVHSRQANADTSKFSVAGPIIAASRATPPESTSDQARVQRRAPFDAPPPDSMFQVHPPAQRPGPLTGAGPFCERHRALLCDGAALKTREQISAALLPRACSPVTHDSARSSFRFSQLLNSSAVCLALAW